MKFEAGHSELKAGKIAWTRCGSGSRLLLVLHGYGQTGKNLQLFADHLANDFIVYFIDLPHHGQSTWHRGEKFTTADLDFFVRSLLARESVEKVSLLGYSIGGRVCLKIIEQIPELVGNVVLMASDGLSVDPFYRFATRNAIGKILFRLVVQNPEAFLRLADWLVKMKWVDRSLQKLARYYLGTPEKRAQLAHAWPCLSLLIPDILQVRQVIAENNIKVDIFSGLYDKLMPPSKAEKLGIDLPQVKLHVVPRGHIIYDKDNAAEIAECLRQ